MIESKLIHGDCRIELKQLEDNSIDLIATDAPYGIKFMGKKWDSIDSMEGFFVPIWKECLRVLKSGSVIFVCSLPRADVLSKQILALEKAGFETKFTPIFWTFASNSMPKSMNLSKAIDKKLGHERERIPSDIALGSKTGNTYSKEGGFKVGEIFDSKPITQEATKLDGSFAGYQPRPAVEIVIVAMKPLSESNYVEQALTWCETDQVGLGGTWLDNCRIPFVNEKDKESSRFGAQTNFKGGKYGTNRPSENNILAKNVLSSENGRFPTNLLVSDKILNDNFSRFFDLDSWFEEKIKQLPRDKQQTFPFAIIPKPSKSEKNKGISHLPKRDSGATNQNWKCSNCNKYQFDGDDDFCKCMNPTWIKPQNQNFHPTVKPIKLMSYLITLALGKSKLIDERIVLDCFAGSGTTALSANALGFPYIMIEKNDEYFKLLCERVGFVQKQNNLSDFLEVES